MRNRQTIDQIDLALGPSMNNISLMTTTTNKAADKSLSLADRIEHAYTYAGQAGDSAQVATIDALRSGRAVSVREVEAIIEALEISPKAFWGEAGGGDKVPMTLDAMESCIEAIEA